MNLRGFSPLPEPSRILIIQLRRIGDVLLTTPAIRALAEQYPNAKIDFAVEAPCDEAVWGNPLLDRILLAPRGSKPRELISYVRKLREVRYDWAVDFFSNPRSAQIAYFSGAKYRAGLNRRGRKWAYTHRLTEDAIDRDVYAVDWRLRILDKLGVQASGRKLEIYADQVDDAEAARAQKIVSSCSGHGLLAAVATGNSNPGKRYPPELFADVIRGLRKAGFSVVITSGPGETPEAEQAITLSGEPVPHLRGARVPALAALYRKATVFVGIDSAPKHVAAACGLPTVTLFGLGNAANWNDPLCPTNVILTAPDIPPGCTSEEFLNGKYMHRIDPHAVVQAAIDLVK